MLTSARLDSSLMPAAVSLTRRSPEDGDGRYYALTPVKGYREVFGGAKDGREDPDCDPW